MWIVETVVADGWHPNAVPVAAVGFTGSMSYRLPVPLLLVARVRSSHGYIDADVNIIIWLSVTKNFRTQITSDDLTSGLVVCSVMMRVHDPVLFVPSGCDHSWVCP